MQVHVINTYYCPKCGGSYNRGKRSTRRLGPLPVHYLCPSCNVPLRFSGPFMIAIALLGMLLSSVGLCQTVMFAGCVWFVVFTVLGLMRIVERRRASNRRGKDTSVGSSCDKDARTKES